MKYWTSAFLSFTFVLLSCARPSLQQQIPSLEIQDQALVFQNHHLQVGGNLSQWKAILGELDQFGLYSAPKN